MSLPHLAHNFAGRFDLLPLKPFVIAGVPCQTQVESGSPVQMAGHARSLHSRQTTCPLHRRTGETHVAAPEMLLISKF